MIGVDCDGQEVKPTNFHNNEQPQNFKPEDYQLNLGKKKGNKKSKVPAMQANPNSEQNFDFLS